MIRRQLATRLGRRGAFLLCIGTVWVIYGTGVLQRGSRFGYFPPDVSAVLDSPWWGVAWTATGLLGVACAFRRAPGEDTAGFVGLQLPPLAWFLISIGSWVTSWFTDYGGANYWMSAAVWAAVLAAVYVVSGWPETPEGRPHG